MSSEKKTRVFTVESKDTAAAMGSGDLEVLATPALIAMIENTAKESMREQLTTEELSVGIEIKLRHSAPTAVGKQVVCEVVLEQHEKAIFSFQFKALVDGQMIASGTHKRACVHTESFLQKLHY